MHSPEQKRVTDDERSSPSPFESREAVQPKPVDAPIVLQAGSPGGRRPLFHTLALIEEAVAIALTALVLVLVLVQVFARYVLNSPLQWSQELARYSLIWATFVGAGLVMAKGQHIAVDVIDKWLPPSASRLLSVFVNVVTAATCLLFSGTGLVFLGKIASSRSTALNIPLGLVYAASLLGFALIAVHSVVGTAAVWRSSGPEHEDSKGKPGDDPRLVL